MSVSTSSSSRKYFTKSGMKSIFHAVPNIIVAIDISFYVIVSYG
jgi:hypothetical protein